MGILALVHVAAVLVLAAFCLGLAASFAARPMERKLAVLRPLALALLFAVLSSLFSGLVLTAKAAAERPETVVDPARQILAGLSEALVFGTFGFAVLMLTWALVAVGMRRKD